MRAKATGGAEVDVDAVVDATANVGERSMSAAIERRSEGRGRLPEVLLVGVGVLLAWWFRFAQDDAFITYRFSRNLARGEGLVFNPGERVEGYTNFLYAVVHAVPERLGWTTPAFGQVYGIVMFVAALVLVLAIARRLFDQRGLALWCGIVLIANVTFTRYATGGMETMQQTALVLLATWALLDGLRDGRELSTGRLLLAGLAAGLAVLTRLDSVVLLATLVVVVAVQQGRTGGRARAARTLGVTGLTALATILPWLVWKADYYGSLIPNTFFAKSGDGRLAPLLFAVAYLLTFFIGYGAFLLIGRFRKYRRGIAAVPGVAGLSWVAAAWMLYVLAVGADFMEYRFMVPILPVLAIWAACLLDRFVKLRSQVVLLAALLLFSLAHQAPVVTNLPVMTFHNLNFWPDESTTSWTALGKDLGRWFPGGPEAEGQPIIASVPIGVIGYYGDLETIDMLGLTDEWVARNAPASPVYYPGHVRWAPPDYLADRGVDLILGMPATLPNEVAAEREQWRFSQLALIYSFVDLYQLPEDAMVLELPAGPDHVWPVIYLGGNEKVDRAIAEHGWTVKPLERRCVESDLAGGDPITTRATRLAAERTCD